MKKLRIDFYKDAQTAIEREYLEYLPRFDGKQFWARPPKENRKDGHIERPIHGGMHVGAASLWVLVLHQLFKENYPQYVEGALIKMNLCYALILATVEPMFDCFVHGTQSSMLVMLEKSGYVLESPVGLLRKQCTTSTKCH